MRSAVGVAAELFPAQEYVYLTGTSVRAISTGKSDTYWILSEAALLAVFHAASLIT